jgi:hypothetical protein
MRVADIERIQLSIRPSAGAIPRVEVEWVMLAFQ